jgi:hypothetical protein
MDELQRTVNAKFSEPHHTSPESLACEGQAYYQCLMYAGLQTLDTLHKTICCIGPGLWVMLEGNCGDFRLAEDPSMKNS